MPSVCSMQCSNALMAWSASHINCELYLKIKFIIKIGVCGPPAGGCCFADMWHRSWHPQHGCSLSDVLPGPCNANASHVANLCKMVPDSRRLAKALFRWLCAEKAHPFFENNLCILLINDLSFQFCTEVNQSPVATVVAAFLEGAACLCRGKPCSIMMLH